MVAVSGCGSGKGGKPEGAIQSLGGELALSNFILGVSVRIALEANGEQASATTTTELNIDMSAIT